LPKDTTSELAGLSSHYLFNAEPQAGFNKIEAVQTKWHTAEVQIHGNQGGLQ